MDPLLINNLMSRSEWVRSLAHSLLEDDAGADDVLQETWLAALRSPPRDPGAVSGWLRRVTRHVVFQSRRARRRRALREVAAARPEAVLATDELLAQAAMQRDLVAAVLSLTEDDRAVVLLKYFGGRSSGDIAATLGLSAGAVRVRLSRALAKIRESLEERYPDGNWRPGVLLVLGWVRPNTTWLAPASGSAFGKVAAAGVFVAALFFFAVDRLQNSSDDFVLNTSLQINGSTIHREEVRRPGTVQDFASLASDMSSVVPADAEFAVHCGLYEPPAVRPELTVSVVGTDLRPARGTPVYINDLLAGRTDATGHLEVAAALRLNSGTSPDRLAVDNGEAAIGFSEVAHTARSAAIRLDPAGAADILVVGPNGLPIAGAHVLVRNVYSGPDPASQRAVTDQEGRARLARVPATYQHVEIEAAGYGSAGQGVQFFAGQTKTLLFDLPRARTMTLTLLDAEDRPVKNRFVGLYEFHVPGRRPKLTNEEGVVVFHDVATLTRSLTVRILFSEHTELLSVPLEIPADQDVTHVLRLTGESLQFALLGTESLSARSRLVLASTHGHRFEQPAPRTDGVSEFRFLPAGYEWTLEVEDFGGTLLTVGPYRTWADGGDPIPVTIQPTFEVGLGVFTGLGVPARATCRWRPMPTWRLGLESRFISETDPDGIARLRLPAGSYELVISLEHTVVHQEIGFDVQGVTKVSRIVQPLRFSGGRLMNTRGEPLAHWTVGYNRNPQDQWVLTDQEGFFHLETSGLETLDLMAGSPAFRGVVPAGRFDPSFDVRPTLHLPMGSLRVFAADEQGRGLSWPIQLTRLVKEGQLAPEAPQNREIHRTVGADGVGIFDLPAGLWVVGLVSDLTNQSAHQIIRVEADQMSDVTLGLVRYVTPKLVFSNQPSVPRKIRFTPVDGTHGATVEFSFPRETSPKMEFG